MNVIDQRVELVIGVVAAPRSDEAKVDRRVAAVGDDRKQDVIAFLGFAGSSLDKLDPLGEMALIGEERFACRRGDDLPT
jgi:hypothetical protein